MTDRAERSPNPQISSAVRLAGALLLGLVLAGGLALPLEAQGPAPPGPAVGIKVTPTDVRPGQLEADFDLTWYTRVGPYSSTTAGYPYAGFPALDYGDGSTIPSTTLVLASSGGGPGGSNVYRNLASFTHTYPSPGNYTVTGASICTACYRGSFSIFSTASPTTPLSAYSFDYVPQTVVGNLAGSVVYSGTYGLLEGLSLRYFLSGYQAVTNTTVVSFSVLDVPTASTWGLAALGGALLLTGLLVLRRI